MYVITRDSQRHERDSVHLPLAVADDDSDFVIGDSVSSRRRLRVAPQFRATGQHARGTLRDDGLVTAATGGTPLDEADLVSIEQQYAGGITAVQIVDVFTARGIRFSEASFRKYVQLGLLPRSRRVGRKGKHRGSLGVYPAKTVRRINEVKALMAEGHTIEEIAGDLLVYADLTEAAQEALDELLARLAADIEGPRGQRDRKQLDRELAGVRVLVKQLSDQLTNLVRQLRAPKSQQIRRSGAAGSAEDLL